MTVSKISVPVSGNYLLVLINSILDVNQLEHGVVELSEEFKEHIFDEFSQENSGARTLYQGTGLGMTITKQYVELMGGTIEVESEKGKGTTVTVDLPLELSDFIKTEEIEKHRYRRDTKDLKVLMAEDNDLNAEIAVMLLEDKGMHVTRAVDGCEVTEMFKSYPAGTFDVVLMDIMMPRMNGYEATRAIRHMENRPDGKNIPIIAMTANAFAEDVQAALDAGMNAHLAKPIVIDTVTKAILENLEGEEAEKM
mgnify:CR=1 FL=1